MYSTNDEGKSVAAERFIRTVKNKIFKHVTLRSKNVYFKVSGHVRIQKYRNIFSKGYVPNQSEEIVVIKKFINVGHISLVILMVKKLFERKRITKSKPKRVQDKKVIKKKEYKIYVKWRGYDNLFNIWIDERYIFL